MDRYIDLLRLFVEGKILASEFEYRYLDAFKNDKATYPEEVYQVLDRLFGAVDAFCAEPALRGPEDLDEPQLLNAARTTLQELEQLQ